MRRHLPASPRHREQGSFDERSTGSTGGRESISCAAATEGARSSPIICSRRWPGCRLVVVRRGLVAMLTGSYAEGTYPSPRGVQERADLTVSFCGADEAPRVNGEDIGAIALAQYRGAAIDDSATATTRNVCIACDQKAAGIDRRGKVDRCGKQTLSGGTHHEAPHSPHP